MNRRMQKSNFKFKQFSLKQKKVLTWWHFKSQYDGIICDGAIRAGKTVSLAVSFVIWAMSTFKDSNFAMCGKTVGSFKRNVWMWLKQALISFGYQIHEIRNENLATITFNEVSNTFFFFGGRDESSQDLIQGLTLAGLLCDEVALMPESFVNQATGRCSVEGSKFWFNCNPDSPHHWFKTEWIDKCKKKNMLKLHFTMEDNLTLSESIKERYRLRYSGLFYKRFILGLWVIADGIIYDMFNESKHVVKTEYREYSEYYVSCDHGTYNPCAFGLYGKLGNIWYKVDEYYFSGRESEKQKTDKEYADDLTKFVNGRIIRGIVVDPSASSFIAELKTRQIAKVFKAKNDVDEGIKNYSTVLNRGDLLFNDCCKNSFKEFASYCWDEKASLKGKDKPLKVNDHTKDEERYFVNTIMFGREIKFMK
jgi:PBSX family phage terminase large subunit